MGGIHRWPPAECDTLGRRECKVLLHWVYTWLMIAWSRGPCPLLGRLGCHCLIYSLWLYSYTRLLICQLLPKSIDIATTTLAKFSIVGIWTVWSLRTRASQDRNKFREPPSKFMGVISPLLVHNIMEPTVSPSRSPQHQCCYGMLRRSHVDGLHS